MSIPEQDVPAHHVILDKQEISILDQRETESLRTKGRAEEPELAQVKEEENESEPLQFIKKEDNIVLKEEPDTSMATDSGSGEIKEEPEEQELQLTNYDCQLQPRPVVKIEVEDICENENQFVLKQETDASTMTISRPFDIKGEPVELEHKQVKEEDHGSGPQRATIEIECISENEKQFVKQVTDASILRSYKEKDQQQPEANGNQTLFQNKPKAEHHHKIKTLEASGPSGDYRQEQRGPKTRSQSDNVEKEKRDKKINKVKKCKQCKVCSKSFKCSVDLTVHVRTHTGEMPSSSISCGKDSKDKSSLNNHKKTHTEVFSCKTCEKSYTRRSTLKRHTRIHTGERPFQCHTCGKCFRQQGNLSTHMRIHTGERPYSCPNCEKCYKDKSGLNSHMITHTGEKPFSCNACGKCFNQKSSLKFHVKIHSAEKPFSCKTCGKGFNRKSNLSHHENTHSGDRPFLCLKCGKVYKDRSGLNSHMIIHSGEKPFSCEVCGKCFSRKTCLNIHMRIHTGEKPFSCISCGKGFRHKKCLINHIKTHTQ